VAADFIYESEMVDIFFVWLSCEHVTSVYIYNSQGDPKSCVNLSL